MKDLRIREASQEDAEAVADVHIRGWQWGYRGLLPDEYLETLEATRSRREAVRRAWFTDAECPVHTLVAQCSRQVVGFADVAPSSDEDAAPRTGYLGALYLLEHVAGKGIGRLLQEAALNDLRARGFTEATLWVLSTNSRACRFYLSTGWSPDGSEKTDVGPGGIRFHQIRYRRTLLSERGSEA